MNNKHILCDLRIIRFPIFGLTALALLVWPSALWSESAHIVKVRIDATPIVIMPTRGDLNLKVLWIQIRCVKRAEIGDRINRDATHATCDAYTVNDRSVDQYHLIELKSRDGRTVHLNQQFIQFSSRRGGHLCIAIKAVFAEVSDQYDYRLYANQRDRYSLLSYCTIEKQPDWAPSGYPFDQNRVTTVSEFSRLLSKPISVRMKNR